MSFRNSVMVGDSAARQTESSIEVEITRFCREVQSPKVREASYDRMSRGVHNLLNFGYIIILESFEVNLITAASSKINCYQVNYIIN